MCEKRGIRTSLGEMLSMSLRTYNLIVQQLMALEELDEIKRAEKPKLPGSTA
jgi:hypothetical protein